MRGKARLGKARQGEARNENKEKYMNITTDKTDCIIIAIAILLAIAIGALR